jgi:hypothetical protein
LGYTLAKLQKPSSRLHYTTNHMITSNKLQYQEIDNPNLSLYQKGVYYFGIKLLNNLPHNIKSLNHYIKMFKIKAVLLPPCRRYGGQEV